MPVGFQVLNDSNIIQIDQDYRNLSFINYFTVTVSDNWWTDYKWGTFTVTSVEFPCLAFRSSLPTWIFLESRSGNNWTFRACVRSEAAATITVYRFSELAPSSSNYGLQVFTAAGQLAFDSNQRYLKVVDSLSGILNTVGGGPITGNGNTYDWNVGVPCAVMPAFIGGGLIPIAIPGGMPVVFYNSILICEFATVSSTVIRLTGRQTAVGTSSNPISTTGMQPYYDFLAVNISGYGGV